MAAYTKKDVGCYVDSARGIYTIDAIIEFAEAHGFVASDCDCIEHPSTMFKSRFAFCEYADDLENEVDEHMNMIFYVEDCYWGRSEQGDWGLWLLFHD